MIEILILSILQTICWLIVIFSFSGREDKQHKEYRAQLDMIIRAFKARDVIEYSDTAPEKEARIEMPNEYLPLENVDPEMLLKKINENK